MHMHSQSVMQRCFPGWSCAVWPCPSCSPMLTALVATAVAPSPEPIPPLCCAVLCHLCLSLCAAELYVWEDDVARTIRFTNARSDGFMSKFDGTWHVQPFNQQTLDSIYKGAPTQQQQPSQGHNWLGSKLMQHSHH